MKLVFKTIKRILLTSVPALAFTTAIALSAATWQDSMCESGTIFYAAFRSMTESSIEEDPEAMLTWNEADLAMRQAMEADPSMAPDGGYRPQMSALEAWHSLLERGDLTQHQRAFGWWRIASLHSYNFDASRGETADYEKAEQAFTEARALLGNFVSRESRNSATVYATLPGEPMDRARRFAETFNWLATRSDEEIQRTAGLINRSGYLIDKKFFLNIANRENPTLTERENQVRERLSTTQKQFNRRITDHIRYSQSPEAIFELLRAIEDTADPGQMAEWRRMLHELEARSQTSQPDLGDRPAREEK